MTKQEQRAMILKKLWWFKKDQEEKLAGVTYESEKIFAYHELYELKRVIRKAMDIQPVSVTSEWGRSMQYRAFNYTYSDEDNAKVDEVIRRMVDQGFIKLIPHHKVLTAVVVLKTK